MFSLMFDNPSHPMRPLTRGSDLELGVDAHVTLSDATGVVFEEPLVAIVELRTALRSWLVGGADTDFEFVTIEADEDPFLYFRADADGFVIGAAWEARPGHSTRDEVLAGSAGFVERVDTWVREHLGILDVDAFLAR